MKPAHEQRRAQIGDVIEIETVRGLAYAHYTHEHREPPGYGSQLHVLPGFHHTRPNDFAQLVAEEDRFAVFFPFGAVGQGYLPKRSYRGGANSRCLIFLGDYSWLSRLRSIVS